MPEGSTDSVRDLDLDEQVQQLVESIENTTRDITAPADEEISDAVMETPEEVAAQAQAAESAGSSDVAAPAPAPPPAESEPVSSEPANEELPSIDSVVDGMEAEGRIDQDDDFGDDAFLSPEEMTAEAVSPAASEATETEAVEPEAAEQEPAAAPTDPPIPEPADSVEQVEAAMEQIDEAVDQLVEDAVEAAEPDPATEPAPAPIPEPADAVEEINEDNIEAPDAESIAEPIEEPAEGATDEAVTEPAEVITEAPSDEDLDAVIEAPDAEADATEAAEDVAEYETETGDEEEAEDEKGPYDEFAIEGDFDSVGDDPAGSAAADGDDDIDDFGSISTEAPKPTTSEEEGRQERESAPVGAASHKAKKTSPVSAMTSLLAPQIQKAVVLVNAPVSRLSPSIRQFVGWSAINFAFLAVVILIVVVLRSMR